MDKVLRRATEEDAAEEARRRSGRIEERRPFECQFCPERFETEELRTVHMQMAHEKALAGEGIPCGVGDCPRIFESKGRAGQHRRFQHKAKGGQASGRSGVPVLPPSSEVEKPEPPAPPAPTETDRPGFAEMLRVVADIAEERARQDEKWGDQSGHPYLLWNAILGEEVGEVSRALLEDLDAKRLRAELVQIAAVAVAWVETIDKRG